MRQLYILLAGNAAVWLLYAVIWFCGRADAFVAAVALPASAGDLGRHPWTLLTYMFSHVSMFHLAANMLFLWLFGMIACRNGAGKTLPALYFAGGLAGALLYLGYGDGVMMGASAAVMAVVTGTGFRFASFRLAICGKSLPQSARLAAAVVVITLVCADGWATLAAHAGGAMAGYLFLYLLPAVNPRSVKGVPLEKAQGGGVTAGGNGSSLDPLLTKVRVSGFESLSAEERRLMTGTGQDIK